MLLLLSYALQGIGSCSSNLLLNSPDALFLLGSQVKTSIQGVRAAPVDFNKLLLIENLLFGNETGADGEVLLGTYIVFLKVIALVETCVVEVPVPCDELDAKPGGMGSQDGSIEVSQQAVVTGQALGLPGAEPVPEASCTPARCRPDRWLAHRLVPVPASLHPLASSERLRPL